MAGPIRLRIQIEGLKELRDKAKFDTLAGQPLHKAFEGLGNDLAEVGAAAAASASGDMKRGFTYSVSTAPVPRYVTVRTTAKHRRFAYPRRLEFDPKSSHRGWLRNAIKSAWHLVDRRLAEASRGIEREWSQ